MEKGSVGDKTGFIIIFASHSPKQEVVKVVWTLSTFTDTAGGSDIDMNNVSEIHPFWSFTIK